MNGDNNEDELEGGLPTTKPTNLSPQQLEANKALVMWRFDQRFGTDDADITNPTLQHSPEDPAAHGF